MDAGDSVRDLITGNTLPAMPNPKQTAAQRRRILLLMMDAHFGSDLRAHQLLPPPPLGSVIGSNRSPIVPPA